MDAKTNFKKVMEKYFPNVKISDKIVEKMMKSVYKSRVKNSVLIEYKNDPDCYVVTDLFTEKKYVYAPRKFQVNEELNLVSGITSLGLFDSDNVYCGQLDPNNTGIREPMVINTTDDKKDSEEQKLDDGSILDVADLIVGGNYDTIFGVFEIVAVNDSNVIVKDRNAVEMTVSVDDFYELNPVVLGSDSNTVVLDDNSGMVVSDKYRILFKTMQNDGSVKDWCVIVSTESELDEKLEEIKKRNDLIEITSILEPKQIEANETSNIDDEQANEEPEEDLENKPRTERSFSRDEFEAPERGFEEEIVGEELPEENPEETLVGERI